MTATAQYTAMSKKTRKYKINLAKSYQLMELHFEAYNHTQTEARHKIKLPHIFLAKELIRLYAMAFRRWQVHMGFDVALRWENMPLLATNNCFLGEITGRTDRTIRNYRKTLERAGFFALLDPDEIKYTHNRGWQADFEVSISPKYLYIESNRSTGQMMIQGIPTWCLRKNFPPTSTSTVLVPEQEQQELVSGKLCSEAEKPASDTPEQPGQPILTSGTKPEQQEPDNRDDQSRPVPAGEEIPAGRAEEPKETPDPNRQQQLQDQVKVLWNYARGWLYMGEHIPADRRKQILARLQELYGQAPPELFPKITQMYVHRLKLAQLYWHRQHGSLPPPEVFFNPLNIQNGFVLTKTWPNDEASFPPPPRRTYRMPGGRRRGTRALFSTNASRRSGTTSLSNLIK